MSVQIIKWIILFTITSILIVKISQASTLSEVLEKQTDTPESIFSETNNMLHSLLSILHFHVEDIVEDSSHITPDKKAFIKLFIYLKYINTPFQQYGQHILIPYESLFTGPNQTAYYIYTLHKIII